jgi:hypothetical protein
MCAIVQFLACSHETREDIISLTDFPQCQHTNEERVTHQQSPKW